MCSTQSDGDLPLLVNYGISINLIYWKVLIFTARKEKKMQIIFTLQSVSVWTDQAQLFFLPRVSQTPDSV